jgi:hypothetical protein
METFVVDASVTLPWCFEDEATAWTDRLLDRLRSGDEIVVPAHIRSCSGMSWPFCRLKWNRHFLPARPKPFSICVSIMD